jgi:hyaluronoglucosaminidase
VGRVVEEPPVGAMRSDTDDSALLIDSKLVGYGEGYYGKPHSWEDRRYIVEFLASEGLNAYVYAPKSDPYHRDRWREPYPEAELAKFEELARAANGSGVSFCIAVSPLGMHFSADDDRRILLYKLQRFLDLGVRDLAILFDDVPDELGEADRGKFKSLGQAHGATAAWVYRSVAPSGARLAIAPTHYAGLAATPYLSDLTAELPDEVAVAWTGRYVLCPEITGDEVRQKEAQLGKPVLVWDNFPVNDGPMGIWCHLGPWLGRDADTLRASFGLFLNGMEQARASMVAVAQLGELVRTGDGFDPYLAWRRACEKVGGPAGEAFFVVAEQMAESVCHPEPAPTLGRIVERIESLIEAEAQPSSHGTGEIAYVRAALLEELERQRKALVTVRKELAGNPLLEELAPWLDQMARNLTAMTALSKAWEAARPEATGGVVSSEHMFGLIGGVLTFLQPGGTQKAVHGTDLAFRAVVQTAQGGWRISRSALVESGSLVRRLASAVAKAFCFED